MSRLQLPKTTPMAWVLAGVLAVILFVVGILAGAALFSGGGDDSQVVLETSQSPTTPATRTPRMTIESASSPSDTATASPIPTTVPVVTEPPPAAAPVAPAPTAPPQTLPPTAPPVTPAPTPVPTLAPTLAPTPAPAPFASWPEAAQAFLIQGNVKFEAAATESEQFVFTSCVVESENDQQRFYVIECDITRIVVWPAICVPFLGCSEGGPVPEALGKIQYRWWWDSGLTEQL